MALMSFPPMTQRTLTAQHPPQLFRLPAHSGVLREKPVATGARSEQVRPEGLFFVLSGKATPAQFSLTAGRIGAPSPLQGAFHE
jgi:hypothetical protein